MNPDPLQNPGYPDVQPPNPPQAPAQYTAQPVAYDQYGRPLYAHPPQQAAPSSQAYQPQPVAEPRPQMVYMARPHEPESPQLSEEVQRRSEQSRKEHPNLNLSNGEYIIRMVKRHPIGVAQIWFIVILLMFLFGALFMYFFTGESESSSLASLFGDPDRAREVGLALLVVLFVLFMLGGYMATFIYNSNRFYLTNESVIQEIRTSLFSTHEQTVSLANVEDASYSQRGLLQTMLGYGSIRLSTEGDETTYRFSYVTNPKKHIATLNNAVEAFKNGRPISED